MKRKVLGVIHFIASFFLCGAQNQASFFKDEFAEDRNPYYPLFYTSQIPPEDTEDEENYKVRAKLYQWLEEAYLLSRDLTEGGKKALDFSCQTSEKTSLCLQEINKDLWQLSELAENVFKAGQNKGSPKESKEAQCKFYVKYLSYHDKIFPYLTQGRVKAVDSLRTYWNWKEFSYPPEDVLMGISFLHRNGCTGAGAKVALLDCHDAEVFKVPFLSLTALSVLSNIEEFSPHGAEMIYRIGSEESMGSIAPFSECSLGSLSRNFKVKFSYRLIERLFIHLYEASPGEIIHFFTNENLKPIAAQNQNGLSIGNAVYFQAKKRHVFTQPIQLIDVQLLSPQYDREVELFFKGALEKKIKIINISRVLIFGEKGERKIEEFIIKGGLIIFAAGNCGENWRYWDKNGIKIPPFCSWFEDSYHEVDLHLHQWLHNNPKLQKGFLLVEHLEYDKNAITYASTSHQAGNIASDRYIAAFPGSYTKRGTSLRELGGGTSSAAATISGILAALQSEYPSISPQEIGQALLDTATALPGSKGRGMVNARAAYVALQGKQRG